MTDRRPIRPRRGDLVEVVWRDSITSGNQAWFSEAEAISWSEDDVQLKTVGYFVAEDRLNLVLAASKNAKDSGRFGGLWSVPRGCIIRRRVLK